MELQNPQYQTLILGKNAIQWKPLYKWLKAGKCLSDVKQFQVVNNTIQSIAGLQHMPNLNKLILSKDDLKQQIHVKYKKLITLIILYNLKGLTYVYYHLDEENNLISYIENIHNLINLKLLNLKSNKITQIKNMSELKQLTFLNLKSNMLQSIQQISLVELENLQYLWFSDNKITSFKSLRKCNLSKIQHLCLYNNLNCQVNQLQELNTKKLYSLGINSSSDTFTLINNSDWFYKLQSEKLQRMADISNQIKPSKKLLIMRRKLPNFNKL